MEQVTLILAKYLLLFINEITLGLLMTMSDLLTIYRAQIGAIVKSGV